MTSMKESTSSYSQFACIGAGFSGIALGVTLKRWYKITDIRFFERHSDLGGTWYANKYPGAACDVPSVLYSYSFEPNPNWSRVLPSQEELWKYQKHVADKYDLPSKMTFGVEVQKCQWIEERKRWVLDVRDYKTGAIFQHECRFLFAGSGILVTPREIDIPGSEDFKGSIFHTSQWRSDVDVSGKNVVVIGNGCTAAQIVPSIVNKTKHLTQIVRAKHWMLPPIDGPYTDFMKSVFKYLPGTMMIQRLLIFLFAEIELKAVPMTTSAAKFRQKRRAYAEKFMRDTAPAKYHDLLIPDFEIGCKRRIYDSGYLASLHSKNLTLTNERALKIVENGVETDRGFVEADVIVLANGFSTNTFLEGVEVVGRDETLTQHWESFGGAEAYNCSAMSGFPNFFMLLGPNATTGHTSAIMAIENSVNFALRILKPVLGSPNGVIELDRDAEERYVNRIQHDLSKTRAAEYGMPWFIHIPRDTCGIEACFLFGETGRSLTSSVTKAPEYPLGRILSMHHLCSIFALLLVSARRRWGNMLASNHDYTLTDTKDLAVPTHELIKNLGGESIFQRCDVSNSSQIEKLVSKAASKFGRLDIIVNTAGIFTGLKNILEETHDYFDRNMPINTRGTYLGCKYAIKQFLSQSEPAPDTSEDTQSHHSIGKIISIASMGGLIGLAREPSYCASKGAVVNLTRQLAVDFGPSRINVNSLCPGFLATAMVRPFIEDKALNKSLHDATPWPRL
ncbi:hypothetical protein J7337_013078 [Fusarium musae]|uniref:L-ornithine N(5)-oxygenase n=1 Tax=Fusarium musae TaxID=1042133 RepID=A0A9P8D3W8_9HYPO|nr:hypothetical protein J7337_013078 [Fusarium musae]KAG9494849.1 hypothetical protein J7337_013078 [Fusarium musae]